MSLLEIAVPGMVLDEVLLRGPGSPARAWANKSWCSCVPVSSMRFRAPLLPQLDHDGAAGGDRYEQRFIEADEMWR